jgi:DNA transformation protein and related proteins
MSQPQARPHDHGLPPALYVIAGASFAAALSARALDPGLPHIAEDFRVNIATAAGFAAVFAFTFSIIQPLIGAAADPLGRITVRRMFGKTGVFCDGFMLGMVRDDTLYFRVDDCNCAASKEAEAFPTLNYAKKGGTIDLAFWRAPERLFDDPDELVAWSRSALEAPRWVAVKRERATPKRTSRSRSQKTRAVNR